MPSQLHIEHTGETDGRPKLIIRVLREVSNFMIRRRDLWYTLVHTVAGTEERGPGRIARRTLMQ